MFFRIGQADKNISSLLIFFRLTKSLTKFSDYHKIKIYIYIGWFYATSNKIGKNRKAELKESALDI